MIDAGSGVGWRYYRAVIARRSVEKWLTGLVEQIRCKRHQRDPESALQVVALHRGPDSRLLDPRSAAVELLNIVRPTVAVDRYLVFLALALHEHPEWRKQVADGDRSVAQRLVNEVRRVSPFFPLVAGRAADNLRWDGRSIPKQTRVLLDLFGTNHDADRWPEPESFDPDRFLEHEPTPYDLIPQGGGPLAGHRCAGEAVTVAVMLEACEILTRIIEYDVPSQCLDVPLSRMPTLPVSGFVISNVRQTAALTSSYQPEGTRTRQMSEYRPSLPIRT
jgi:fatty-acid peroxygenase